MTLGPTAALSAPPSVTVRVSAKARRVALRLDPARRLVHLIVPRRMSLTRALEFAHRNSGWIERSLARLPDSVSFDHGVCLPLLGRERTIRIVAAPGVRATHIALADSELCVRTGQPEPGHRIHRFLKILARDVITEKAEGKASILGKAIRKITIRDPHSRWGSCSAQGALSFSWRLIFAPPEAMDYVIAHEVAHLRHMDHSSEFWKTCALLSDDFSAGKRWMRLHGHSLLRYGPLRADI